MLKIIFYPESDVIDFSQAIKEYEEIWQNEGQKITDKWQEITGLEFKETEISAIVADLRPVSAPLTLRYGFKPFIKKYILVHELGHRILRGKVEGVNIHTPLKSHKLLFLVNYDVVLELYGEEYLNKIIEWKSKLARDMGHTEYEEAWNWVLQYKTKEKRQEVFKNILGGDLGILE